MNVEQQANEIVENYQKERLTELWGAVESWKKCGCHKCSLEAEKAMIKFYDEYYFIKDQRHPDDSRDDILYVPSTEEVEDLLTSADIKEVEIADDMTEEELVEYFLSLKFKDTLVCFKYCGTEIWIYYDKDGRPEEYGDKS